MSDLVDDYWKRYASLKGNDTLEQNSLSINKSQHNNNTVSHINTISQQKAVSSPVSKAVSKVANALEPVDSGVSLKVTPMEIDITDNTNLSGKVSIPHTQSQTISNSPPIQLELLQRNLDDIHQSSSQDLKKEKSLSQSKGKSKKTTKQKSVTTLSSVKEFNFAANIIPSQSKVSLISSLFFHMHIHV